MTPETSTTPRRVQLSRRKGWRMPPDTVLVARPSRWGNPFSMAEHGRERSVALFRETLLARIAAGLTDLTPLRGKNLACWCALDQRCHADVLLEFASRRDLTTPSTD